ncbi:MAG: Crp/Fnr family transcriptional regulator [Burkholderiaceae bacterium]|nr:Crp/Fnr family transcriptional regulator [Burkholderiaceae bacterium]
MPTHPAPATWPALLRQGRWFAALPPARQQALLERGQPLRLEAGQTLFHRGDANAGLYAVLGGAMQIGAVDAQGRELMLGLLEPPQWFGEIALFDDGPRTHDAVARSATLLLRVPREVVQRLLDEDALWWRCLGQLLAEKTRALFIGLEDLAALPAPQRIARRLLALADGHGMRAPGQARRELAVNQEQLGAMLALTRQTVSEVLRDFESRGWVHRGYGRIGLLDPPALAAMAASGQPPGNQRPSTPPG